MEKEGGSSHETRCGSQGPSVAFGDILLAAGRLDRSENFAATPLRSLPVILSSRLGAVYPRHWRTACRCDEGGVLNDICEALNWLQTPHFAVNVRVVWKKGDFFIIPIRFRALALSRPFPLPNALPTGLVCPATLTPSLSFYYRTVLQTPSSNRSSSLVRINLPRVYPLSLTNPDFARPQLTTEPAAL